MRLTLPFQLNHVNVYALQDGDGWTVVDTGLRTPDSIAAWEAALAGALTPAPTTDAEPLAKRDSAASASTDHEDAHGRHPRWRGPVAGADGRERQDDVTDR